jgi:DNA-binding IclR family transcriptional regulator
VESSVSGVGVLDKSVAVLAAIAADRALTLAELSTVTGLPRATVHRLAVALETHGLVRRDQDGRFALGLRLVALARAATVQFPVADAARPVLERLRDDVGESVQLYVREGAGRRCLVSLESPHGLRWIVPEGVVLPLDRGSAGTVLLLGPEPGTGPGAAPGAVRWVESIEARERGVCSVSAPVRGRNGEVVAAVSVSGPVERLGRQPGRRHGQAVVHAAAQITRALAPR